MDNKKDNQGHTSIAPRISTEMDPFSTMLLKKCERIATAIYLITNFLSDTEPLKFRLRTLSLDFVRDALPLKYKNSVVENNVLDSLKGNIHETLTLLELAFIVGIISEMNFTILKHEYVSLRETIEIKRTSRESRTDNLFDSTFFNLETKEQDIRSKTVNKGQNNISMSFRMSDRNILPHKREPIIKTIQMPSSRTDFSIEQKQILNPATGIRATTDVAKDARRSRILKLIKDNGEVAIKDIATHFSDLSEKTLQRELVALVEAGILKKSGERRWSRYAIA